VEEYTFLIIVASFLSGWILKSISYRALVYNQTGIFVNEIASKTLTLVGTTVYKVSVVDQLCTLAMTKLSDSEEAKVLKNELEETFMEWKRELIKDFIETYPEEFKWQLEFTDWEGAMEQLTCIYKKRH
jgi:hypothetical protein